VSGTAALPGVALRLDVNGTRHDVSVPAGATLLAVVRDDLGLTGTKEACGRGECGACTMLVAGAPVMSCLVLAARVRGPVTTIEGLAQESADLRAALADTGGAQCGFCTPGQVVRAAALLREGGAVSDEAGLRRRLSGNICRCTGYDGIVDAIVRVAAQRSAAARRAS
jgi:aerobic-type carbon monoxide dehydrogenase small subunit (CoxS/CutS family)